MRELAGEGGLSSISSCAGIYWLECRKYSKCLPVQQFHNCGTIGARGEEACKGRLFLPVFSCHLTVFFPSKYKLSRQRVRAGSGQLLGTGVAMAWDFIKVKSRAKASKMGLCSACLRIFALLENRFNVSIYIGNTIFKVSTQRNEFHCGTLGLCVLCRLELLACS